MNNKTNYFLKVIVLLTVFLLIPIFAMGQISVSGTVISDDDQQPMPGVSIVESINRRGVITDNNGKFTILVPNENSTITLSFIGMEPQILLIGKQRDFNVTMRTSIKEIDKVVVVGYGSVRKSDLTGSVVSMGSEELMKNRSGSVLHSLQGKLAGVNVSSSSGEPGSGVNISIRGSNSINAGSQPLYVIDGIPIEANSGEIAQSNLGHSGSYNPLAGINASDIESINVLKDASATAIYGSQAANGVIIITTKTSKDKALIIDLDTYFGVSSATRKIPVLMGQNFADYQFARNPTYTEWGQDTNGDAILDQVKDFSSVESMDWQKELMQNGITQSYYLGLSNGGGTNVRTSGGFGYSKQDGIVKTNTFERYTGRMKMEGSPSKKFKIGFNSNFEYTKATGAVITRSNTYQGVLTSFLLFKPYNFNEDPSDPENVGISSPRNFLMDSYKSIPLLRLSADIFANYTIIPNLTYSIKESGTLTASKSNEWYPTTTTWGYVPKGLANISETSSDKWLFSNTLTYSKGLKGGHSINAMVGTEWSQYTISGLNIRAENFAVQTYNGVFDIAQASVLPEKPGSYKTKEARMSQFGRLNYTIKDCYLFTGTLRRDGSSKFGINNKYALFPSTALAWKMHNESFMKEQSIIKEFKWRVSWGAAGNDRIPAYRSISRLENAYYANNSGGSDLGLAPAEIANPNLKWETTYQTNAGVDIQLFEGRVAMTFDYYMKDTKDMLLQMNVPSQSGSFKQWQNIGQVRNHGYEFLLSTTNISAKNFVWTTNFNFNINRNKIVSLGGASSIPVEISGGGEIKEVGRLIVGESIGTGWGYEQEGVYQNDDFENGVLKPGVVQIQGITSKPGDLKFRDLSGDSIVDPMNDKTVISKSEPDHFGGMTNNFTYKNFDLSIFLQWSAGNQVMNIGRYYMEGDKNRYNITEDYWTKRWTTENPSNKYPSIVGSGKTESSSYYVEDASYLRIKNIVFGYNVDKNFLKNFKINDLRVYVSVDNVLTFTNYSGYDPEVQSSTRLMPGVDNVSYPRARTFNFGLNVKF